MTLKYPYTLLLGCCLLLSGTMLFAQDASVINLSADKKKALEATLNQNKELVAFIENTLVQNSLPRMMRNLCLIEAGFDKNAVSAANAGGVWQFMEAHAAQYGLQSKDRFDVYHSTQTAMKSLKALYSKYGNWITVVAAYNCGEGNIKNAMNKARSDRYEQFYKYLPAETVAHVRKFKEACMVTRELDLLMADYRLSAFKPAPQPPAKTGLPKSPDLVTTTINAAYSLNVIAAEMDVAMDQLLYWNPDIQRQLDDDGVATLHLPIDKMPDFLLLKNTILNRSLKATAQHDQQEL